MSAPAWAGLRIVCLASYFKGTEFLRECRLQGAVVVLLVREKSRDEDWPHEAIDELVVVSNQATPEQWIDAVSHLARHRRVDRLVALEEYDVMTAAMLREHLRVPGMGTTTARLFRDKLAMRVKSSAAGVLVPSFVHVLNEEEIRAFMERVPPPWVLKPRMDVSAIGIQKLDDPALLWLAIQALDARPVLTERASYFVLEQFVPGDVFHVDSLVQNGTVLFAGVNRYWRPPMEVAHHGGVFVTTTVPHDGSDERALLELNARLLKALGFQRGATHAEFIRGHDGRFYFLEIAGRVGGAFIADVHEAATGLNLWREWAKVELACDQFPYAPPSLRTLHAGIALALARQEWPDTSDYDDPRIMLRVRKRHHVGLVVADRDAEQVEGLLAEYVPRITNDFLAVLPPRQRAE